MAPNLNGSPTKILIQGRGTHKISLPPQKTPLSKFLMTSFHVIWAPSIKNPGYAYAWAPLVVQSNAELLTVHVLVGILTPPRKDISQKNTFQKNISLNVHLPECTFD